MSASSNGSLTGLLISGGLDSSILLAKLLEDGHRVQPFYVRSGVVWETWELNAVRRFLQALGSDLLSPLVLLDMPVRDIYSSHWSVTGAGVPDAESPDEAVYLPGRNALLLIKAAIWCQLHGIRRLALAPLGTSPFADASPDFVRRFEGAMNLGSPGEVRIDLPFAGLDKRQVMQLGQNFPLEHTFSCISPANGLHCGQCNKCAERRQAFGLVGRADPTNYAEAART
jgi:7-cyano-7-deazaguanine synthase